MFAFVLEAVISSGFNARTHILHWVTVRCIFYFRDWYSQVFMLLDHVPWGEIWNVKMLEKNYINVQANLMRNYVKGLFSSPLLFIFIRYLSLLNFNKHVYGLNCSLYWTTMFFLVSTNFSLKITKRASRRKHVGQYRI